MGEAAGITLERLHKQFGEFVAVNDLDLDIRPGEFVSLLGPSGCGKTTTLRMLAGLEFPTRGTIRFGERVVNDLAPAKRNIAMVFQSYALYPHMTVAENIAYPLKKRGVPKARSACEGRGGRAAAAARNAFDAQAAPALWRPAAACGAWPRAWCANRISFFSMSRCPTSTRSCAPTCVPNSSNFIASIGKTMVYVTHDQLEAMTMSSRIAVMRDGLLQQFGTPAEIYDRPANVFVAGFHRHALDDAARRRVTLCGRFRRGPDRAARCPVACGPCGRRRARQDRDQARREAGGYHSRRAGLSGARSKSSSRPDTRTSCASGLADLAVTARIPTHVRLCDPRVRPGSSFRPSKLHRLRPRHRCPLGEWRRRVKRPMNEEIAGWIETASIGRAFSPP